MRFFRQRAIHVAALSADRQCLRSAFHDGFLDAPDDTRCESLRVSAFVDEGLERHKGIVFGWTRACLGTRAQPHVITVDLCQVAEHFETSMLRRKVKSKLYPKGEVVNDSLGRFTYQRAELMLELREQ